MRERERNRDRVYTIERGTRETEEVRDKKSTLVAIYFWVLFILNFTSDKLLMRCPNVTEPFCQINMFVVVPVVVQVERRRRRHHHRERQRQRFWGSS